MPMIPGDDKTAIELTLNALIEAGWEIVNVNTDGARRSCASVEDAVTEVTSCDEGIVSLSHAERDRTGWVYFVLGNDPREVACDYTLTLDPTIENLQTAWWGY